MKFKDELTRSDLEIMFSQMLNEKFPRFCIYGNEYPVAYVWEKADKYTYDLQANKWLKECFENGSIVFEDGRHYRATKKTEE